MDTLFGGCRTGKTYKVDLPWWKQTALEMLAFHGFKIAVPGYEPGMNTRVR